MSAFKNLFASAKTSALHLMVPATILLGTIAAAATPAYASIADVRVVNRSSQDILSVYVAPTYRGFYGDHDVLRTEILDSGHNMIVDFGVRDAENQCVLDILALGSQGGRWTKRMNVCTSTQWTLYD